MVMVQEGQSNRYATFANASPTTPFLVGSLTKSLTAMLVWQQIQEGKVALDEPVTRYFPDSPLAQAEPWRGITVRHLLCHSSGIPASAGQRRYEGSLEAGIRALASISPSQPALPRHEYSNANYMVLGGLLERVTGQSYRELLQQRILDRLGMNQTRPGFFQGRPYDTVCFLPGGGVSSTAEDWSLYLREQLSPRCRSLHKELLPQIGYGFGWYCDATGNWTDHSGEVFLGNKAYQSFSALHPKVGKGFVIFTRMPRAAGTPSWRELVTQIWKNF